MIPMRAGGNLEAIAHASQRVQHIFVVEDHEHEPHRILLKDGSL